MKKFNYNNLDQNVYSFTLKNGFQVYLVPYKKKKNYYAVLGTKYGSMDINFKLNDKDVTSPFGTAHFLEHKMFEQEDGIDPFKVFSKSGVSTNASTTFTNTRYYIWGVNELEKNLNFLLDFVYSPYFTDSNVEKEKGIIKEEILMYEDDTSWALDDTLRKNMFHELPVKEKIAGSVATINEITKEDLYDAYNAFYNPSNMYLVIGGNIDIKSIKDLILNHEKLNSFKTNNLERKIYEEPNDVKEEFITLYKNIKVPKIEFGIKINKKDFSFDDNTLNMYLGVILTSLFGGASNFRQEVMSNNLATNFFEEKSNYQDFLLLTITAESDKADILVDKIKNTFKNIKMKKEELERIKKVWIASEIRMIDNVEITVDNIYSDLIQYNKVYENRIEEIRKLNTKDLNKVIKELDVSNQSLVMILPLESEELF